MLFHTYTYQFTQVDKIYAKNIEIKIFVSVVKNVGSISINAKIYFAETIRAEICFPCIYFRGDPTAFFRE